MIDYADIMEKQRAFFATGKTKDYTFRKDALKSLRESILYYSNDIDAALKADLNKAPFEGYVTEYGLILQHITHALHGLKSWMKPRRRATGIAAFPGYSKEYQEPYGVVLIMSPWNFPIQLTMCALIGAIAAGNCVIIKPSAYSPESSEIIAKVIARAFPSEYITVIQGGRAENTQLLEQRFDYIFFTGSITVGKLVMEKASKNLTPVTLELGGKSPCIITEDASIKKAAKAIAYGKLMNCGQVCVCPDYVLIPEHMQKEFCDAITEQFKTMIGDALTNDEYPRIVNQKHFDRVKGLMEGVTIYSGGRSNPDKLQIEPTVLVDVTEDSPVMQEEIFGPLLPVITYKKLEEAEAFVLRHEKPLALYLFTESKAMEKRIMNNLSFGGGCVNSTIMHLATKGLGFGGVGYSGMGMYHGKYSFDTFSHTKGVYKKSGIFDVPLAYHPYDKWKMAVVKKMIK